MRYWIYWNELVQGPFEIDELTALKAFDEDLLVCMEDREDWVPASRVADLSPSVDLWRSRKNRPPAPPPPPPPDPVSLRPPLQGELFGESPAQTPLFRLEGDDKKGPYAYTPVYDSPVADHETAPLPVTMPFHFGTAPDTDLLLAPPKLRFTTVPTTKPIPVPKRPVIDIVEPVIPLYEPPLGKPTEAASPVPPPVDPPVTGPRELIEPEPFKAFRPEPPPYEPPVLRPIESPLRAPLEDELPPPPLASETRVPLSIVPDTPEPMETPPSPFDEPIEKRLDDTSTPFDLPGEAPSADDRRSLTWMPWVIGVFVMTVTLGSVGYWLMDRSSSHAAISAVAHPAVTTPEPVAPAPVQIIPSEAPRHPHARPRSILHQVQRKIQALMLRLEDIWAAHHSASSTQASVQKSRPSHFSPSDNSSTVDSESMSLLTPEQTPEVKTSGVADGLNNDQSLGTAKARRPTSPITHHAKNVIPAISKSKSTKIKKHKPSAVAPVLEPMASAPMPPASGVVPVSPASPAASAAGSAASVPSSSTPEKKSWWHRKSKTKTGSPSTAPAVPGWAVASPIDENASKGAVPLTDASGGGSASNAQATPAASAGSPAGAAASGSSVTRNGSGSAPSTAQGSAASAPRSERAPSAPSMVLPGTASASIPPPPSAPLLSVPSSVAFPTVETPVATPSTPDSWAGRQNEAITMVMTRKTGGRQSIGDRSSLMLHEMHEKELLHAAETGERLYLPDKMNWSALREQGSVYRVYLDLSALQGDGERTSSKQYSFRVDLSNKSLTSDDAGTRQDFLDVTTAYNYKHNPMTDDMESLLSGVDEVNKQMVREIMVHKERHQKEETKKIEKQLLLAQARLQRALIYFRTQYPEKSLTNLANAYNFVKAING